MSAETEFTLNLPRFRKAKASIWKDISVAETDKLLRLTDGDVMKTYLQETLQISEDDKGRHLILIDTFFYAVRFCQKNSFSSEKTSCFLSIIKQTHEMACETPYGNLGETVKFFKDLVLCYSVHRPPFSLGIFSPQEASVISYYFIDTYFRHFKLYKYAFTPQVQLDLSIDYLKIPKTSQELDEEKKSFLGEIPVASRSDPEGLTEIDSREAEQQAEEIDAAAASSLKSASLKELKRIVRERLSAEVNELRSSFSSQIKVSDDALGKLVAPAQQQQQQAPPEGDGGKKSGPQSAKKKK